MIYSPEYDIWKPFFAILPRRMPDGTIAFFHRIWRKRVKNQYDGDYCVYSYYDRTDEEKAAKAKLLIERAELYKMYEAYAKHMAQPGVTQGVSATGTPSPAAIQRSIATSTTFDGVRRVDGLGATPTIVGAAIGYAIGSSMESNSSDNGSSISNCDSASSGSCSYE